MKSNPLRYLPSGYVFIDPEDDCDKVVDALLETGYSEEFCLARDFEEGFITRLMEAGFLVMSTEIFDNDSNEGKDSGQDNEQGTETTPMERFFILLPKLHLIRSVLFFGDLHIKKSIRRFIPKYELRINTDFDLILESCIKKHGEAWLTPPLVGIIKNLQKASGTRILPVSFGVYREGKLKAGEIGVAIGRVYTSYSGFYEEDNAGTVQMILMAQWLEKTGFDFLDFGMPLDYKNDLGARDITPAQFIEFFRAARY